MRVHTQGFKDQIKELGREIDSRITFGETVISNEELFSISPVVNASLLKSVMKQLDFESSVQVPLYTVIKYEFGLKVNDTYEYIDFGNYIVYSSEYNEDTKSYEHTCYDSMLFSMKEYETLKSASILGKTFPMSVRDYITCLCADIGLVFRNANDKFANYDKIINSDLYANLGYTYRDIFDELSQVTASNICIDLNDMVEVRYINDTNDTIDEEYLKDINVKFGEKYGPINSIVLSRSSESDNVYLQNEQSVATNGLCEIKISDNQIMNNNDRSDYLPSILSKLNGLEYYLNDFTSTGIMYYELCDKYNVKIGENTYSCVLFNDEPKITQGLVENIYTERPEESVTDYTKADKTDRKINQTYLIVDKQNQKIQSVVEQTDEQNQKINRVVQTAEELNSKISDIADITSSQESNEAEVSFEKVNQSEPIRIVVRPIGENISYLYPSDNLYPSDDLFLKVRTIRFHNKKTDEDFDYELPDDLLYYDSENYDEFILDYDGQSCVINKKVGYNADGTTYVLDKPTTVPYPYPTGENAIILTDGDYVVSLLGYDNAYLFVRLMAQNIYTTQFATRAEVNSEVSQTANKINSEIDQKLSNYSTTTEMNNKITQEISKSESKINLEVNKKVNNSDYNGANIMLLVNDDESSATINADKVNITGVISAINNEKTTTINGDKITTGTITADKIKANSITSNQVASDIITTKNFSAQNINADKITSGTINGTNVTVTNINADNIKTGTIASERLDTKVITTENFSAQKINADNITSGTLSADKINGGTFTGSAINLGNGKFKVSTGGAITSTSGTIGGWTISSSKLRGNTGSSGIYGAIRPYGVQLEDSSGNVLMSTGWGSVINASTSDRRLKNRIGGIEDKFEKLFDNLKPVTFYFNELFGDDKKHIGFIAQDLLESQEEISENLAMVYEDELSGKYHLNKQEIIALNTWQIQKLKEQLNKQQEQIELLKQEIELLKNKESDK